MADFSIPPWLARDYNPVDVYVRSFQTGAQIGEERSRLAEQQRQANMDAMAKREALQANILRAQVELDVQKSYHDQQLALRQQELAQEQARNEAISQRAAADLAERQAYHQMLEDARQQELGFRKREVAVKEAAEKRPTRWHWRGGMFESDPETGEVTEVKAPEGTLRQTLKPGMEPGTTESTITGTPEEIMAWQKAHAAPVKTSEKGWFERQLNKFGIGGTPAPTTTQPYPDGTILRKKDGSRWIVKDGVPIRLDEGE